MKFAIRLMVIGVLAVFPVFAQVRPEAPVRFNGRPMETSGS